MESILLFVIGLADLFTTLNWVNNQGAQEANPIFRFYLSMGPIWFSAMKLICLIAPIFLLEWAARRRPCFTRWASRCAILCYMGMYTVGVLRLNPHLLSNLIVTGDELVDERMLPDQPLISMDEFEQMRGRGTEESRVVIPTLLPHE